MAKGFSIMDMMSEMSREGAAMETETIAKVSVFDIQPNEDNFYELSNMEQLKNSIYAMGGVQQNLLLARLPAGGKFKYKALAGHRRTYACLELVKEGHKEFEYVPAVIQEDIDKDTEEMLLVMTNSTQRELTDWEKVMQHMKLKEIIPRLKKRQGLYGKTRALEADYLGVSEGQIAIYNTIGTKLHAELMDLLKNGRIGISLAYEAAKLAPELQEELIETAHNNGSIYEEDIKRLVGSRPIEGQLKLTEEQAEVAYKDKVTESDTHEEKQNQPVYAPPEKQQVCYTTNEDDINTAIDFIFCLCDFPEDKLNELINCYANAENYIGAKVIFQKMLPYENGNVSVIYKNGYQIEYIHTGEIYNIPVYYFWKGFEREFKKIWKEEKADQPDAAADKEKVTESDTFDIPPAAVNSQKENRSKKQEVRLRGGYEPFMVDSQISKYKEYRSLALTENREKQIHEFNCLLDALDLLKARLS